MKSQESIVANDKMSWSVLSTGPYMDMLNMVRVDLASVLLVNASTLTLSSYHLILLGCLWAYQAAR